MTQDLRLQDAFRASIGVAMTTDQIATSLFTRQQLGELTGLDNTTLNYWSREDLLAPSEGGAGRGSHRRFDFVQVNIAAMLGALRQFRLGLNVLTSFADMLQEAAKLGRIVSLHPGSYTDATSLADTLHRFRSGEPVLIRAHEDSEEAPAHLSRRQKLDWSMEKRPAVSEQEIISQRFPDLSFYDYDPPADIIAAAEKIGPGKHTLAGLYFYLTTDILDPGYCDAFSWLIGWAPDGRLRVEFGSEGAKFFDRVTISGGEAAEEFGPGIFIPASGIIRKIWGPRGYDAAMIEYRQKREERLAASEAARMTEALSEAGITANVTVNPDGESFKVDAPETPWPEVEKVLRRKGYVFPSDSEPEAQV
jgi:DNA-binding transcriptional MerR regulator